MAFVIELSAYIPAASGSLSGAMAVAGVVHALIDLRWEPRTLTLNISDDGGGRPANHPDGTSGYGLLGLKERVEVAGGSIEWGPRNQGFFLSARLPSSP